MFLIEDYTKYVLNFLQENFDKNTSYKSENLLYIENMKKYSEYVIETIINNGIEEKDIIKVSKDFSDGFKSFKTYEKFTRKEKIKKLL